MWKHIIILLLTLIYIHSQCDFPKCDGLTCGTQLNDLSLQKLPCPCTEDHMQARFTEPVNGTKTLFFYWKPPATCYGGQLPPPIRNLPVSLQCKSGEYLNVTTRTCEKCEAGTYSGENVHIRSFSGDWPLQMSTHCWRTSRVSSGGCDTWKLRGEYMDSGNNTQSFALASEVVWNVEVFDHSSISFLYTVSAEENFDYFEFLVDEKRVLKKSNVPPWERFSYNLTKGYHTLKFRYVKDFSLTRGEDRVKVKDILLTSTNNVVTKCPPCPPGYISERGAGTCTPCPENTYADTPGSVACKPCPPLQRSFPGSSSCVNMDFPCTVHDFYYYYTPCNQNNKKYKIAEWIKPKLCNSSRIDSVMLPPRIEEDCLDPHCSAGQKVVNKSCDYCGPGKAGNGRTPDCISCAAGEYSAHRTIHYETFVNTSTINTVSDFRTGCSGECTTAWRSGGTFMDSGIGNGISSSWIEFDAEIVDERGGMAVDYTLSCPRETGFLEFYIDNLLDRKIVCRGCNVSSIPFPIWIPKGNHTIRISYRKLTRHSSHNCDKAIIKKISIYGVKDKGGFTTCLKCPPGTFSTPESMECKPCKSGTYSIMGSESCKNCSAGYFSFEGSSSCFPCGAGMTSKSGSDRCEWLYGEAKFKKESKEYDWKELAEIMKKHYIQLPSSPDRIYFNLDGNPNNTQCGNSFACAISRNGTVKSLGDTLDISTTLDSLLLQFTNYKYPCGNGKYFTSKFYLTCAPEKITSPILAYHTIDDPCTIYFQMFSKYGCPICKEEYWTSSTSMCIQGKKITSFSTPNITCSRGIQKQNIEETCWNVVEMNIWLIPVSILIGLLILGSIATVGVVHLVRYVRLRRRYQRLVDERETQNRIL